MKKVIIVHGWEGSPQANWFPWLKKKLEARGFIVEIPAMPDTMHPTLNGWLAHLQNIVREPDENTYFVGHSLGVITILRYIESFKEHKNIGGAVLVAGFPEPIGYNELNTFFAKPLDYQRVKQTISKIIAIHSDNDPYISLKNGEILKEKLGAKLIIVSKGGHLNIEDGFTELPVALDAVLEIAGEKLQSGSN